MFRRAAENNCFRFRRVMLVFHARRTRHVALPERAHHVFIHADVPQHAFHHLRGDSARTQNDRHVARRIDDAGFHADLTGAAIQNQRNAPIHIFQHVQRRRRAGTAAPVGARRGNRTACRANQRPRIRVGGQADAHRIQPRAHRVGDAVRFGQNQRHRAGPERLHQLFRSGGDGTHQRRNFLHAGNVGNQRVILWAALRFKNLNDGLGVQRVCAQPIDRLCRKADQFALADELCAQRDGIFIHLEQLCFHRFILFAVRPAPTRAAAPAGRRK